MRALGGTLDLPEGILYADYLKFLDACNSSIKQGDACQAQPLFEFKTTREPHAGFWDLGFNDTPVKPSHKDASEAISPVLEPRKLAR